MKKTVIMNLCISRYTKSWTRSS